MNEKELPNLKEAVLICLYRTRHPNFEFRDFKYLLFKREPRIQKEKKKLYEEWAQEFKNHRGEWKPPFKCYNYVDSYLAKTLNQLVSSGELDFSGRKYNLSPEGYLKAYRNDLFFNLKAYNKATTLTLFGGDLNLYGLHPRLSLDDQDKITKEKAANISKKIRKIEEKLKDIRKDIIDLNMCQIEVIISCIINQIKNGGFPKKDKKIAYKFLGMLYEPTEKAYKIFRLSYDGDNPVITYKNKYVLDKGLCELVFHIEYLIVNFFLNKPVVFNYAPNDGDIDIWLRKYFKIIEKIN